MSPSITRASAYTLTLAPIIALLILILVTLLPSSSQAAGSVNLVNQTFECSSYPQPVDFDLVKVTITDQGSRRDAFHTGDHCTGRIGRVEIEEFGGDGMKIHPGTHDLVIQGGYVHCNGVIEGIHQDGIQVMGGQRVTLRNLTVDCTTATNGALYINMGAEGRELPTDVVCDGCTLMKGPTTTRTLRIGTSLRSGARNSVILWCGNGPGCTQGDPVWFGDGAIQPINSNNTFVLYRNYDGALPPPPASPPPGGTPPPSSGAPVRVDRPEISGTAREGETLRTSNGTWTNSPARYLYQWLRCDTRGDRCGPIRGANTASLRLGRDDVGHTIRVVVTASNSSGSASAQSRATSVVDRDRDRYRDRYRDGDRTSVEAPAQAAPATETPLTEPTPTPTEPGPAPTNSAPAPAAPAATVPVNTAVPAITGVAQEGETFTASAGSWSGSPTAYEYQWRRCDASGERCERIRDAANLSTYVLTSDDVGHTLRVYMSASNAVGTGREKSLKSEPVAAAPAPAEDSAEAGATTDTAAAATDTTTSDATGDSADSGDSRTRKR